MLVCQIILCALAATGALFVVLAIGPHFWTRRDPGGDVEKGLVIFAESIRWVSVRWGMRTTAAGLRRAGYRGEFRYWRWHASWRGWLVLPAIMDRRMFEREARRLADFITAERREKPDRPVYLMGYSCGAFVAVRALELLAKGVTVEAAALLAGALDPRRDLSDAAAHVKGRLTVASSRGDWLIAGLGTLLFGTADRVNTFSAGMIGLRPGAESASNIVEIRWRPGMVRLGHLGEHFSATAPAFVTGHIAPELGIGKD